MSRSPAIALPLALLLGAALSAQAQSSCSSDGQAAPTGLLERFISADCAACWADPATPAARPRDAAIDWVLPGQQGDEAPLSAVARRDALARLQALGRPAPAGTDQRHQASTRSPGRLRVAHGLPFNDYIGASIEWKPATRGRWTAWLALVETLPAGTEGSPVERRLVRNLLQVAVDSPQRGLTQWRPMQLPEGTRAERLRVVGWVEDSKGRMAAIAQSVCPPERRGG